MKISIDMFRLRLFFILLFFLSGSFLFSHTFDFGKNAGFDFDLNAGIKSGKIEEIIKINDEHYPGEYTLSQLDWNLYVMPVIKLDGTLNVYNAVLNFSYLTAVPVKSGIVTDSDWNSAQYKNDKTNYSEHSLIQNKHYEFEISGGYEFEKSMLNFLPQNLSVLPQLGFNYRNQKFEAKDGYLQYASYHGYNFLYQGDVPKDKFSGLACLYEQQFFTPFLSLTVSYLFLNDFKVSIYGKFFPYIRCDAIDYHWNRKQQFNDFMKNGKGFQTGLDFSYKRFSLCFNYEYMFLNTGYTNYKIVSTGNGDLIDSDTIPNVTSSLLQVLLKIRF